MPHARTIYKKPQDNISHAPALIDGFIRILYTPITSFLIIFILTIALFLSTIVGVSWKNLHVLKTFWNQHTKISLYLKKNVHSKVAADIAEQLKHNDAIMDIRLVLSDEGMQEFAKYSGFGEILSGTKENPLPHVIVVYPKLTELSEDQLLALVDGLKNLSAAETVNIDMNWIKYSYSLLGLLKYILFFFAILFSMGALSIICFVAYVTPQIIIDKTNIQYQCFWYSLISSLLAIAMINFILMKLHTRGFVVPGLGITYSIIFIVLGVLFGTISSRLAITRII